VPALICIWRLV